MFYSNATPDLRLSMNEPGMSRYLRIRTIQTLAMLAGCCPACAVRHFVYHLHSILSDIMCTVTFPGLQVFEQGQMRGYWKMSYCDAGFRVFYTNKGNMFVLRRLN